MEFKKILREESFGGLLINSKKRVCEVLSKKEFKVHLNDKGIRVVPLNYNRKVRRGLLQAPITVKWSITRKCNLYCKTCYCPAIKKAELSEEAVIKVIDEIYNLGIPHIIFGGGEPFMRKDFLKILEYASNKGFEIDIDTNSILLNDKLLSKIKNLGIKRIDLSLDGPNDKINDYIRGEGTFQKIVNVIKTLKKEKFYIGVGVVLTDKNFLYFKKIIDLLASLNVDEIHFLKFKSLGRGKNNPNLILKEPWGELKKEILEFALQYNHIKVYVESSGCNTRFKTATITPEGEVTFCPLYEGIASFGKIGEEPFSVIWDRILDKNLQSSCNICGS